MRIILLLLLFFTSVYATGQKLTIEARNVKYTDQFIIINKNRDSFKVHMTTKCKLWKRKVLADSIIIPSIELLPIINLLETKYIELLETPLVLDGRFVKINYYGKKEYDVLLFSRPDANQTQINVLDRILMLLSELNWSRHSKRKIKKLKRIMQ